MTQNVKGRTGELLRFGLGARNWLLGQMENPGEHFSWTPPEGGKSAAEIAEHVASTVEIFCAMIAEQLNVEIALHEAEIDGKLNDVARGQIRSAYEGFKDLCGKLDDNMLEETVTLPPQTGFREGPVETVLRVIAGYHAVHHAGQIVMLLKRAKRSQWQISKGLCRLGPSMTVVPLFDVVLVAVVVIIGLGLFAYSRRSGGLTYGDSDQDKRATISDKLRYSKQHDIGFFDGEEEQYSETQSRLRQVGGA